MPHDYYSQREAAEYLGISPVTLNHHRNTGDAPVAIKLGTGRTSHLAYRRTALDRWAKTNAARKIAKAKSMARAAAETQKAAKAELRFRKRIAEIMTPSFSFTKDDFRKVKDRCGYATISSIPPVERDGFLSALTEACAEKRGMRHD